MRQSFLSDLVSRAQGGESAQDGLERFMGGVSKIETIHPEGAAVVSSHGGILSLYFSYLAGDLDMSFDRWCSMGYCCYGIVSGGTVIKDIVE